MIDKHAILTELRRNITDKISELESAIQSLKESRDTNTKSTAGDKHETSRAIIQAELDKAEMQLRKLQLTENELARLNADRKFDRAEAGALIVTDQGNYFISIGFGKVQLKEEIFYCISLASPLGEVLRGKRSGDTVMFQGRKLTIQQVF